MTVLQAIISLLYDHDIVVVPALGAFVRHDESARVNVITNEFQRPTSILSFDASQREENPLLMEHLMLYGELSDEDARQEIAAFVADCYAKLREGEAVILEGIGTLRFNSFQEPEFEPEPSADFNAEAFGLEDLEAQSVFLTEPVNPVVVPADPVVVPVDDSESDDDSHPRRRWLWLLLVLLIAGGMGWFVYTELTSSGGEIDPPVVIDPPVTVDSTELASSAEEIDTSLVSEPSSPQQVDSLQPNPEESAEIEKPNPEGSVEVEQPAHETPAEVEQPHSHGPTEVVKPNPDSKAFIIGGCFGVQENALNMAKEAFDKGCAEAFVMQRGSKFFVCYGQYSSSTDAKAALPEILEKYNPKAWILTK